MYNWDYDSFSVEWYLLNLTLQKRFWWLLPYHVVRKAYCITSSITSVTWEFNHWFCLRDCNEYAFTCPRLESSVLAKYVIDSVPLWFSYFPQISFNKVVYFFFIFYFLYIAAPTSLWNFKFDIKWSSFTFIILSLSCNMISSSLNTYLAKWPLLTLPQPEWTTADMRV